ncbi:MAG: carboxymuconolactone decarboxylase family protein [Xanthobacteraceae bacterium]|nr:carboxymuconolactone decarboxylase family protein [Xanthobacteraceae bacterium]MBX3550414.1 carboxymuconolactone decarboxylase family protein [Xanthobacteraceae bacterium]MCW5674605.1 carboxymuconolactone decarboxylase family protein [Xanthobacteraceae bacterium]
MTDKSPAAATYAEQFRSDPDWMDAFDNRMKRLESGELDKKSRELVFVVGHLINNYGEAAKYHQQRARRAGANDDDFRLILKILDFYRGLRIFQDAQKLVSIWRTGNFPELKAPVKGSTAEIYQKIIESRTYIANGFRVYGADGEWLKLYLQRSDAVKKSPKTLDERLVQLISMAITLKNHRYSNNWNDGCIQVHEDKSRALGTTPQQILEVVQILEICDSLFTAYQGQTLLELNTN